MLCLQLRLQALPKGAVAPSPTLGEGRGEGLATKPIDTSFSLIIGSEPEKSTEESFLFFVTQHAITATLSQREKASTYKLLAH
ncbi:MAG: hypothetical protein DMF74_18835 [Acidobacteria bacterium]|nr:MAG: hypothetical protein DMF74_18835 [Acidobacteriota bacterium]